MIELTATEQFFEQLRERVKGPQGALEGKKALIVGIANNQSIAYGCALAFRALGADIAMTYLNDKTKSYTQPLADHLGVDPALYRPCDVRVEGQLEAVFEALGKTWGTLDIALHSIAFAPRADLHGRVTDCSLAYGVTYGVTTYGVTSWVVLMATAYKLMRVNPTSC